MTRGGHPDWAVVRAAFDGALELDPPQRGPYLAAHHPPDVVGRVLELLKHHAAATDFLMPPPSDLVSDVLHGTSEPAADPEDLVGLTLVGRYEVGPCIGIGGTASVHAAEDRLSGERVAVKIGSAGAGAAGIDLIGHEATALRLLRLPGVVELLDSGQEGDRSFFVMPLVDGRPFPGLSGEAPYPWDAIRRTTISLLEALARVHWTGTAHCDLKPSNVLVTADGTPVILDLGIAQDPGGDESLRRMLALAGTPRYAAPEQLMGAEGTHLSDLYAVGVMLYEALAGQDPHDARDATEVICFRPNVPPPPLADAAPMVPPDVAALVDRLIAASPSQRPASATECIASLRTSGDEGPALPRFLGPRTTIEDTLAVLRRHASIDIWGSAGAGKTSTLDEVAATLREEGRQVAWARPSNSPFGSLAFLFRAPFQLRAETPEAANRQVEAALGDALEGGLILVVDDFELVDAQSARVIDRVRTRGAVVRSRSHPTSEGICVRLLGVDDLRSLFHGHERVHHLPSDAAAELHRRTFGRPGEVRLELASWERAGVSRWEGQRVHIRRADLDRLRGGLRVRTEMAPSAAAEDPALADVQACADLLGRHATTERCAEALGAELWNVATRVETLVEAGTLARTDTGRLRCVGVGHECATWTPEHRREMHARLASTLPAGASQRLYHRLMAGDTASVPTETDRVGRALIDAGRPSAACVVIQDGIQAMRRSGHGEEDLPLLALLLRAALETGTSAALDRVLYATGRASPSSNEHDCVERIARAALLGLRRDTRRALSLLPALEDCTSLDARIAAASTRMFLIRQLPPSEAGEAIVRAEMSLGSAIPAQAERIVMTARAWLAYAREAYVDAATLHAQASAAAGTHASRTSSLLNSASAWLEAGRFDTALQIAEDVRTRAAERRHVQMEARAERVVRAARYRAGDAEAPDLELVEAVADLNAPHLEALISLNEAAVAWRGGRRLRAQQLATRAHTLWRKTAHGAPALLAQGLAIAAGIEISEEDLRGLLDSLDPNVSAPLSAQTAYLASVPPSRLRAQFQARAREAAGRVAREHWDIRREIVSIAEAVQ